MSCKWMQYVKSMSAAGAISGAMFGNLRDLHINERKTGIVEKTIIHSLFGACFFPMLPVVGVGLYYYKDKDGNLNMKFEERMEQKE
jgi:hypothetical protein